MADTVVEQEHSDIQKKVFGRWINQKLTQDCPIFVTDLFYDLRDGKILLDLVSRLTQKEVKREQTNIRVQKLRNVELVLNVLRENRVKLSGINSSDIVDGKETSTLQLVWSIVLHWQFHKVLQQSSTATFNTIEKSILSWCQHATSKYGETHTVRDFTRSLADGMALACILHQAKPELFDIDMVKNKSPRERLEFVFRLAEQHFGVAKLLDPEDVHTLASDKKSVMTYVMSMFEALPHDLQIFQNVEDTGGFVETVTLGSPLKNPSSLKSGKLLDYNTFCQLHEDVLEWLIDAEDQLQAMASVSDNLDHIRCQFEDNSSYMAELDAHQKAVGEVIKKGRHLLCTNLTTTQEKDVRVRQKLLIDRWEGLRQRSLSRQTSLHIKLMDLQRSEMQKLRTWMTETEDKISRMSVVGCTMEAIEQQEAEHRMLEKSLEEQHSTVHSISNFIYVETDQIASPQSVERRSTDASAPREDHDSLVISGNKTELEECDQSDLEGQLMALGERWTVLCTWVEERAEILRITRDELHLLEREKERLSDWLNDRERVLREMDRNPSDNPEELQRQGQIIAYIKREWSIERKALLNVNSVAEKLVTRCMASIPENEGPSEAIKNDTATIAKTVETIQDRWDILTEILEAQKQRAARQGIDMEKVQLSHKFDLKEDYQSSGASSGGEENTPKKRRITGTKRIEFETNYAKASTWLQKALEILVEIHQADSSSIEEDSYLTNKNHLQAVNQLNNEIKKWRSLIGRSTNLGERLISEIQSEEDYPPDYLNNVSEKVKQMRDQMTQIEAQVPELVNDLSYKIKKEEVYQNLNRLTNVLKGYEAFLHTCSSNKTDDATTTTSDHDDGNGSGDPNKDDDDDDITKLEQLKSISNNLVQHDQSVSELKILANQTLLHAVNDPENSIKSDLYSFCERWNSLESKLSDARIALKSRKTTTTKITTVRSSTSTSSPPTEKIKLREVSIMEADIKQMKKNGNVSEAQITVAQTMLDQLKTHQESIEGITLWMDEVSNFLNAEDASAFGGGGDDTNLDTQLKDSNALLEDIKTLKSKLGSINSSGLELCSKCAEDDFRLSLQHELETINSKWNEIEKMAEDQNTRLASASSRSQKITNNIQEIEMFMSQLKKDLPENYPVKKPADLSQLTFKLLHFKDKIERKRGILESLISLRESSTELMSSTAIVSKITHLEEEWKEKCEPVIENYKQMKVASTEYGEFKTLVAQESDWLERLEKKLRKSSSNTAADAEEISEELNAIENFLDNHPEDRLCRIRTLAESLTKKNILISTWLNDAKRLEERWGELKKRAKARIALLESSIAEAQEWEYKLIGVQDWLTDRDVVLSSHLEHELTVDDLPDESQAMLREFEDQENLLAEMDEQVDAYRAAGKLEAALRLEDQLHLIHERFQELSMKFELFQQQPSVEYEPRLARVARQLRDIKEKLYLTELASAEKEGIEGQIHHARCIQNALMDIKPEVSHLLKIGRKLIEGESGFEKKADLKEKVDALEKDYHEAGCEVVQATRKLNEALDLSEKLHSLSTSLNDWLTSKLLQTCSDLEVVPMIKESVQEMVKKRESYEEIRSINAKFFEHCNPSLLTTLKENMVSIDEKWSKVHESLSEKLVIARKQDPNDEELAAIVDDLDELEVSESRKLSSMSQEDAPLFEEFRTAFQEISDWISRAESKLGTNRESQERAIGQELDEWKPKIGNLRKMAEKLVQLFVSQKDDVEPEMAKIDQRWDHIVREVEKRIKANEAFRMVEVEEIKTTISHLSIPVTSEPVVTVTQPSPIIDPDEEIETLIEDDIATPSLLFSSSSNQAVRFDTNSNNSKVESSTESLSGETIKKTTTTTTTNNNANVAEPVVKSPPPQPLPKPRWYLEQRAKGIAMPMSPEKVKVTENTLPSPQRLIGTVEKTPSASERQMPEKTLVMSTSTTPSSTLESPQSTIFGSLIDDDALAKENAAIDHLLAETELQLEEVARHVRGLSVVKDKEQLELEAEIKSVMTKIDTASRKLDELDAEQDLKLRRDLVDMEGKVLDAEVPALISRGETLILMAHRKDPNVGKQMQDQISDLRRSWQDFKARIDTKKTALMETQAKLKQFKKEVDQFKRWLSSAKVKLVRANHDKQVAKQFVVDVKNRQSEIDHINSLATYLQRQNALMGHEMSLNVINSDWSDIFNGAKPLLNVEVTTHQGKLSTTPGSPLMKSAPAEVGTRMAKLLDALAAIDRQLDTQILGTERPCENLNAQGEALTTVKNALDKLKPTLRQTDQDLDKLSGKLSMEYFEKLSNSNSRLHKDWERIKYRYAQRQELWNKSKTLETDMESRRRDLEVWIKNLNNDHSNQITNEDIESKGKMVAELTAMCKEFMCKTSAQDAMSLQADVDKILRNWKEVLAQLTRERKATSGLCDKVDGISLLMSKPVNVSDQKSLHDMITKLSKIYEGIGDLRSQLCHRINTDQTKEVALLKARTSIERLAISIPRRIDLLKDKMNRLETMIAKRDSVQAKIFDLSDGLKKLQSIDDQSKQHMAIKSMNLTLANMQYEVNRVLNDFGGLEREILANQFDIHPDVAIPMQNLKEEWLKITGKIRHLAATGARISSPVLNVKNKIVDDSSSNGCTTTINYNNNSQLQQKQQHQPPDSTSESAPITTLTSSEVSACSLSPTTCSQSSFQSDEAQLEISDLASQIESELQNMLEEATQPVSVHEPSIIRKEVEKQQQVMRRLESKRDDLDNFATGNGCKGKTTDEDLHARIGVLREMCNVIKHRVISRKSECTAMASDSEQFARKFNEIDSWLTRLDGIFQSTYPLGQTLDVLEHQHQSTMDALKELSKYDHHIKLFVQVCERMNNLYSRDNTEEIVDARQKVDERHKKLVAEFTQRRNEIQAVQNSFASYNKSVERFFDWLFDVETVVEQLENDCESNFHSMILPRKFEDVKHEIHDKDRVFHALNNTGNSLTSKMASEEKTMLSQKLSEMSSRWKGLQNKMLDINLMLQKSNAEMKNEHDDDDDSSSSKIHISVLHANLRDHMDWVLRKKRELASLSLDGDVKGLKKQFEEHSSFKHQLNERSLHIHNGLSMGKKLLNDHKDRPEFESCLENLQFEWKELCLRSEEWNEDVIRMIDMVKNYEDRVKELDKLLFHIENELHHVETGLDDPRQKFGTEFLDSFDKAEAFRDAIANGANSILHLSQSNKRDLENLNRRLKLVLASKPSNQLDLDPVNDQDFLSESLPSGWERRSEQGIPYYVNHKDQITQWDHPEFSDLMETLLEMNTVKYSVYRMALKLRKVQQKLCLDLLDLKSAVFAFEQHGLTSARHDNIIKIPEIVVILTSIYEAVHEDEPDEVSVPLCVDLCLNWLLNVYDPSRYSGQIRVLSLKIGLLVLCRGPLTEKYVQLFHLISSKEDTVNAQSLALLLFDAIQIPKYLAEVASFGGSDIEPSVKSCFSGLTKNTNSEKDNTTSAKKITTTITESDETINCKQFLKWLQKEPQSMVWLPVLHRLSAAETATHNTKCKACKIYPIVGFRYHCLKCFNFDLCHNCFFVGRTAKGHKADHPTQEYCTSTGRTANIKILGQAIRNSFRTKKYFKKKQEKLGYLPVGSLMTGDGQEFSPTISPNISRGSEVQSSQNQSNNTVFPKPQDEHNLIAEYCQMLNEHKNDDDIDENDAEFNVRELESERKALLAEYQDLSQRVQPKDLPTIIDQNVVEDQTKQLRHETTRMETRMKILMEHNSQLELQLQRLRQLVLEESNGGGTGGQFGTLQSKSVIARDLQVQSPRDETKTKQELRRDPPPLDSSREYLNGQTDIEDDEEYFKNDKNGSQSSLDLSAHETQIHEESD